MRAVRSNKNTKDLSYVVILTKADMDNARVRHGKAKASLKNRTIDALKRCGWGPGEVAVILTSSKSKIGRDDVWRYIQAVMQKQSDGSGAKEKHSEWFLDWKDDEEEGKEDEEPFLKNTNNDQC
mmetsp:Transcript_40609/g.65292  ORF Transcript_40609/g.65292 Transcript_40609/m.65292 type:complete len:124 (+) Transcript_40609:83-454(+)